MTAALQLLKQKANDAAVTSATTADNAAAAAALAGPTAANTTARATRDDMFFESYYDFDITASAESDNGVSVSLGFDMGAGNKIDYNDDDELEAQGNDVADADVAVSYAGWTLTVDQAGIDNLFDDTDGAHDAKIAGTFAGWSVAMTTDQERSHKLLQRKRRPSLALALTVTGTNNDDNGGSASKIAASYAMGDLTLKGSVEDESLAPVLKMTAHLVSHTQWATSLLATQQSSQVLPVLRRRVGFLCRIRSWRSGRIFRYLTKQMPLQSSLITHLGGGASAFAAMHDKPGTANDLTAVGLNFAF